MSNASGGNRAQLRWWWTFSNLVPAGPPGSGPVVVLYQVGLLRLVHSSHDLVQLEACWSFVQFLCDFRFLSSFSVWRPIKDLSIRFSFMVLLYAWTSVSFVDTLNLATYRAAGPFILKLCDPSLHPRVASRYEKCALSHSNLIVAMFMRMLPWCGFPVASDLFGERASYYPVQCTAPIRFSLFHSDGTRTT